MSNLERLVELLDEKLQATESRLDAEIAAHRLSVQLIIGLKTGDVSLDDVEIDHEVEGWRLKRNA